METRLRQQALGAHLISLRAQGPLDCLEAQPQILQPEVYLEELQLEVSLDSNQLVSVSTCEAFFLLW